MTVSLRVTHHTARLNGITQHWVSAGDGPPVYLLHGFPETWFAWRKQIPGSPSGTRSSLPTSAVTAIPRSPPSVMTSARWLTTSRH
jgi:pimeloyl-ACP methyl ester carboxylesterase